MAEIKIKKKRPMWPWIVVILIIIIAVVYFLFYSDNRYSEEPEEITTERIDIEPEVENEYTEPPGKNTDLEVAEFLSLVKDKSRIGTDTEYTRSAVIQLFNAVKAQAGQYGVEYHEALNTLKGDMASIDQRALDERSLSGMIKDTGNKVVKILQAINQKTPTEHALELGALQNSVEAIDHSVPITRQQKKIRLFFDTAADVLKNMNR